MSFNAFGSSSISSLASHKSLLAGTDKSEKSHHSCGIWTRAAYLNHCCTSTARRAFIGDMMVIRATRDMAIGTEITFWYHSPINNTVADLQKKLDHWGFVCDCAICEDSRATSTTVIAERKRLLKKAKQLFNTASAIQTNRIERVLEDLEKTYSKPADEAPRVQLWDLSLTLTQAYAKQGKPDKCLEWVAKALKSLGFILAGASSSPLAWFSVVKWGLVVDQLVVTFLQARDAFMAIGSLENSVRAEDYARLAYKIIIGEDSSFSVTYS
jgi:SET domain